MVGYAMADKSDSKYEKVDKNKRLNQLTPLQKSNPKPWN